MVGNINKYDITLNANGGKMSFDDWATEKETEVIHTNAHGTLDNLPHFPELKNVGNIPLGWFTSATGGTEVKMDTEVNGVVVQGTKFAANTTVYAHWKPQDWNVTFNSAGGSEVDQQHIGHHGKVTEPAKPTRGNYTFVDWYKDAEYETKWDFDKNFVESDITLYAKWKWNGEPRTVTFRFISALEADNGSHWPNGSKEPIEKKTGEGFRLEKSEWPETPIREDYDFTGWWRSVITGGGSWMLYDETSEVPSGGVTLYARWVWAGGTFTITFDANGGTLPSHADKFGVIGEGWRLVTGRLPRPVRTDGLYFVGWFTEKTGGEEVILGVTKFRESASIYAHWASEVGANQFVDSRVGRVYREVHIGDQTWMKENLDYDGADKGEEIGVCYGNDPANCDEYGRLYTWYEAMAACPTTWKLPSDDDWTTLVNFAAGGAAGNTRLIEANNALKTKLEGTGGTDAYGFTARLGGSKNASGFRLIGETGRWWTSTGVETNTNNAWTHLIYGGPNTEAGRNNAYNKENFLASVRCIKE
jgi:uncharacterized protein (TIGR02145 family)/uncharacterized repeat protein (TIGR02543 family)